MLHVGPALPQEGRELRQLLSPLLGEGASGRGGLGQPPLKIQFSVKFIYLLGFSPQNLFIFFKSFLILKLF